MSIEIITGIIALFISILALVFTWISIRQTHKHNENSVLPYCDIRISNKNNSLSIILYNVGNGPMLVSQFNYVSKDTNEKYATLKDALTDKALIKTTDYKDIIRYAPPKSGMGIKAGGEVSLLSVSQAENADPDKYQKFRRKMLFELGRLEIRIEYKNIYGRPTKYVKDLNAFARTFERLQEEDADNNDEIALVM